jgi:NitT/TauT family transport system substrate-binding protein
MKRSTVLGLLSAAPAAPLLARAARADETLVRMATINIDSGASPYFAQEAGFFKEAGLRAEFATFNNGQAIAAAVAGGALDIATSNPVALAAAHARGVPFVIVAPGALYVSSDPTTVMMVPKDSPIAGPRDLAGKTIACNGINGIPHYCSRAWIDKNGGDSSGTKFVEMNFAQMMDALGTKHIDAACVTEPYISEARSTGRAIGTPFDACAPRFMMSVFIANQAWAQAHQDEVRRFQGAMLKVAAWANRNRDKTAPLLMKFTQLPAETVRTMHRAVFAERWRAAEAQPLVDLTAKYGNVPDFSIDEMLYRA